MDQKIVFSGFKSKKLITQLFTTLLGFSIILMIVVSILVSRQTTNAFIDNNNLLYSNTLKIGIQTLDAFFSGYHDSLTHITYDATIMDYVIVTKAQDSVAHYQVWSVLDGYSQENEAIEEIFLYVKKSNQVLTSSYETYDLDDFPQKELIMNHMAAPAATHLLKSGRSTYIKVSENHIYMVRDFPLKGEKRLGTLYMRINPRTLYHNTLSDTQTSYSTLLAYDSDWSPLFPGLLNYNAISEEMLAFIKNENSAGDNLKNTGYFDEHHWFSAVSEQTGLNLVLAVNDSTFTPALQMMIRNSLPFFVLILVLSILLTACILYLTYMPMLRLTRIITSSSDMDKTEIMNDNMPKNEWNYLTNQFLSISEKKHELDQTLHEMLPKISKEFYLELLSGQPMDSAYIQSVLKSIGSPLTIDGIFGVIVIAFLDEIDTKKQLAIVDTLSDSLNVHSRSICHYVIQKMGSSHYVVMMQFASEISVAQINKFEVALEQDFFKKINKYQNQAFFAFGPKCKSIQNLSVSYSESMGRLSGQQYHDRDLSSAAETNRSDSIDFNPKYFNTQLKSISGFVMKGDTASALEKASQLCAAIADGDHAEDICRSYEYYRLACLDSLASYNIKSTAEEELSFVFKEDFYMPEMADKPAEFLKFMEQFSFAAISLLEEKYRKQQHKYMVKAKNYIELHYSDPDLSLQLVADKCNTTTSYLSRLFKESFGVNFVEYLNEYRIEKAKELLDHSNTTVKDIALSTGFNSQQNFIRVFKKHIGLTPGQYKNTAASGQH